MRSAKKLQLEQLEKKLKPFAKAQEGQIPEAGWIKAIRSGLNMTMAQLGVKLNITRQGVKKLEDNEANGSISLNSLRQTAEALEFKLVYALVPKDGSIQNLINQKAEELARKIVLRTHQSMKLENQAIAEKKIKLAISELSEELKRDLNKSLWD
ncbi:mobile mystery protein A [Croceimicrobium hydrocarbonivorans]|uniref:Mobile mystery protein A n=1 Tax=Croceimicrobium hydrocarbonivorans TaxID=2761580 RepID=A0A7H0VJC2_9FLAO|nr:mobile mystery protein A [Croceimicrobium hydrocarbonivorans]QNR25820.1 mobile mystery protein A [Croceimicrobium hydrocarbonivorans]